MHSPQPELQLQQEVLLPWYYLHLQPLGPKLQVSASLLPIFNELTDKYLDLMKKTTFSRNLIKDLKKEFDIICNNPGVLATFKRLCRP